MRHLATLALCAAALAIAAMQIFASDDRLFWLSARIAAITGAVGVILSIAARPKSG